MSAGFNDTIFSTLGLEMIFRLIESDTGAPFDMLQHFPGKIDVAIQTSANCSPAERNFAQSFERFLRARLRVGNLLCISGKFLTQPNGCCVHQMRSAYLD